VTKAVFAIPTRVYIEDTDAGGIVYYVNYLKFMERSRTEFLRALGYDKPAILEGGLLLVVHSATINYRRPARLDDLLQVSAYPEKLARTYIEFHQQVTRGDEVLCEGGIRIACVQAATMKPCALPADIYRHIDQMIQLSLSQS
jgi:4-hydroxybenzoyl-CoA thioesterase